MPGVNITTATRTGPTNPIRATSGRYFVTGISERGPVDRAVELRSMADYARVLGDRVSYGSLFDDLRTFFEEGGGSAFVARIVGAAASVGSLTLLDRAATPVGTLRIDAADPGAWSTRISVEVANGTTPDTFRLLIRYDGVLVEDYNNLASPAAAASRLSGSQLVRAVNLGSATAPPGNNPAVLAPTALSAGNDARGSVVDADYLAGLARFDRALGDGLVAVPGITTTGVRAGLATHSRETARITALHGVRTDDDAALRAIAVAHPSEHVGVFGPWIVVPDGTGGSRTIPPTGYVAACRARAHNTEGPYRAPAGEIAEARYVIGVDRVINRTAGDALDAGRVSAIRLVANSVRLYGWRSTSADEANYALLTGRDTLNRLEVAGEQLLEGRVFATIDGRGQLLSRIAGELAGIAQPLAAAGGLFARVVDGEVLDPGFSVDVGGTLNPIDSLARNRINAQLAARVSPTGALINLTLVKVGVTAAI